MFAASKLNHCVKKLPVVDLEHERTELKVRDDVDDYVEHFCIRNHRRVSACNVEITLVELSEATLGHLRLVASVNFSYVEALDVLDSVLRNVARERYCEIIPEGEQFSTLVLQVVN